MNLGKDLLIDGMNILQSEMNLIMRARNFSSNDESMNSERMSRFDEMVSKYSTNRYSLNNLSITSSSSSSSSSSNNNKNKVMRDKGAMRDKYNNNDNNNNNNKIKQDDLRGVVHADDNDNNEGNHKKSSKTADILSSTSNSFSSYNYSRVDVGKHEDNEADDDGKIKRSSVFFNLNQLRLPLPSIPNNIRNRALSKKNTNNNNSPTSSESNINISQQTNSNPANNNPIAKKRDKIPLPLMNMELGLNGDWVIASGSYVLKPKLIKGYLPKGIVHFIGRSICHHDH
jgi:hypothetical protein